METAKAPRSNPTPSCRRYDPTPGRNWQDRNWQDAKSKMPRLEMRLCPTRSAPERRRSRGLRFEERVTAAAGLRALIEHGDDAAVLRPAGNVVADRDGAFLAV